MKIQIGPKKHGFIYHLVEEGMWQASDGGGDIKNVWMCQRGYDRHESEKKLILVEFADKVVAYDCRWSKTTHGVVFTEPDEKYCRTAAFGDVSAVFTTGWHEWLIKQRDGWRSGGWCRTEVFKETDGEPMGEEDWVWVNVRVLVLWHLGDELPADWLMLRMQKPWKRSRGGKRKQRGAVTAR